MCIERLIYFIFSGETWRLPFLMLSMVICLFVCSFARSFTYYIFAVVYFGYDKSLLYLNSSICKVINFSLSLSLIPKNRQSTEMNETIYLSQINILFDCLLWMSSLYFFCLIWNGHFLEFACERWLTHSIYRNGHCSLFTVTTTEIISFPRNMKIALVVSCT